jgi:hypothetical protein
MCRLLQSAYVPLEYTVGVHSLLTWKRNSPINPSHEIRTKTDISDHEHQNQHHLFRVKHPQLCGRRFAEASLLSSAIQMMEAGTTESGCQLVRALSRVVFLPNTSIYLIPVFAGVDVSALLSKIGINVSGTSERVGAVAIAYTAHKALSPVRFPPTVALTPVVAKMLGKEAKSEDGTGK